jgi:HEAT repeat protein
MDLKIPFARVRAAMTDFEALDRHEVAFVMGQLATDACRPSLEQSLSDSGEHPMVRHEAAEALGALGHDSVSSNHLSISQFHHSTTLLIT